MQDESLLSSLPSFLTQPNPSQDAGWAWTGIQGLLVGPWPISGTRFKPGVLFRVTEDRVLAAGTSPTKVELHRHF